MITTRFILIKIFSLFHSPILVKSRVKILFFLPLALSCCTPQNPFPNEAISIGISQSPSTLDPRFATDANGMRISSLIFQSLVRIDNDFKVQPMAARKWSYQNKIYTFYIPKSIKFSNGRSLTKEDLTFSFNQFRSPSSPFHTAFSVIKKISVNTSSSDFILKIYLKSYSATFLNSDLVVLKILPKKETLALKNKTEGLLIGSGPFSLVSASSSQIVLKPRFSTSFKKVVFKIIRDDLTRFQKILKNELHIVQSELPYSKIDYLKKIKIPYRILEKEGLSMNYMIVNLKDPLFKNLKARQAVAYSINKKELIQYKLKNFSSSALSILHNRNPFYNKKLKPIPFNLEKGKNIVKANNWQNKSIKIKTSNNKATLAYAKVIAHYLRGLGFKVQILSYEWGTFYGDLKNGRFQLALLRWVGAYDPDIFRIAFDSKEWPPMGRNRGFYKNTRLDHLVQKGRIEPNLKKRISIYKEVQQIIRQELPIIPLWHNKQVSIVSDDIEGYYIPSNGSFDFLMSISLKNTKK